MIKLVIFDLDGTLVDAYQAITKSFNHTMRRLGYPVRDGSFIRRAVGWGDRKLLEPYVKPADLKKALEIYRDYHKAALIKWSRLLPGVRKTLSYLEEKGYKLAVASNRPTRFCRILLKHLKLSGFFGCVLCADKLKHAKPHPEILRRLMSEFNVSAQETCFVGDMVIDAMTARSSGVKSVIVTGGSSKEAEIRPEKPFRIIRKFKSLQKIL